MSILLAEAALDQFLELMDAEDWERLVEMLASDVELADELTATWLRGRERVAGYLRAQTNVVTEITSTTSEVAARPLGDDFVVTFSLRQHYLLDGTGHHESLTGCAIFTFADSTPLLTLFHLGEAAAVEQRELGRAPLLIDDPRPPPAIGERIRARRESLGLTLRVLASKSGLSAGFLSQVERSQVDLSVRSLRSVAAALGTTSRDLLDEPAEHSHSARTGRHGERARTVLHELGMTIDAFRSLPGSTLESWVTEIAADAPSFEARRAPDAQRFVYVLDGVLAIISQGTLLLTTGEGAHLDGNVPYRLGAHGDAPVRFLSVQATSGRRP